MGRYVMAIGAVSALMALQAIPTAMAAPAPGAVVVSSRMTSVGRVLVDGAGNSLYDFSGDGAGDGPPGISCLPTNKAPNGTPCTTIWPPLLATPGSVVAGPGVNQKRLGTEMRPGIGNQVTYFGKPLYRFLFDTQPGQTHGEDVTSFFGFWRLVSVDGTPAADRAAVRLEPTNNGLVLATPTVGGPGIISTRTLYHLTTDPPRGTSCVGPCAAVWPPLLTDRAAAAGPGVDGDALSTLRRPDGTHQVTYMGQAVYMFAFDLGAGAPSGLTNGNNFIDPFASGVWYTISPNGLPDPGAVSVQTESSPSGPIVATPASPFVPGATSVTAYTFIPASPGADCVGSCARFWPPLLTSKPPVTGPGADPTLVSSIQRPDGSFQITYNGHPLYLFSRHLDSSTGGEGITAFGGTFEVVNAAGVPS